MRKSMYLIGLAVIVLFGAGCSKDKGNGTTRAYSPNSCYNGVNNGYANNGYNNSYNGGYNTGYNGGYNGGYGYNNVNYNRNNNSGIGYNNSQYGQSYGQRYQWQNGHCIDTNDGDEVSASACNNVNYSNNSACTNYGYGNGYYQGNVQGAYNACSIYNTAVEQFYPVYYANLGVTVCAGYSAFNTMYGAGIPAFYPGYNNVFQGCIPGVPGRCACNSFGGRLGWFSAGIQLGVCY